MKENHQAENFIHRGHPQSHQLAFKPDLKWVYSRFNFAVAFGFGAGLIKPGPGTWGSILAFLLWLPLKHILDNEWLIVAFLTLGFVFGCYACHKTGKYLRVHDYGGIVWDEMIALWLVLFVITPVQHNLLWSVLALLIFRIYDIFKPWPIKTLDCSLKNGLGVMLDDILAALYTLFTLAILMRLGGIFMN
ncbi:phosphatidylglycerophosphatase A family protein [Brackiella oedipodis]|uniref:phosphatidylglycerophosphatase A family protein n=1 Tax=Brackiella oedipodis TaxID=124225 RepID=UPI000A076B7E|nr:phosphatidylglycerophosphatase A [Brackiella oedipodis]